MTLASDVLLQLGWLIAWTFITGLVGVPIVITVRGVTRRQKRLASATAHCCFLLVAVAPVVLAFAAVKPKLVTSATDNAGAIQVADSSAITVPASGRTTSETTELAASPLPPTATPDQSATNSPIAAARLVGWLPAVWLIGASLTGCILFLGVAGTLRLRFRARPLPEQAQRIVDSLLEELQSTRLRVKVSELVSTPILVGVLRPLVLLPATALGWPPDTLRFVLLHEIAHARRWDNLVNLVQRVVEVVLFFQPAVWMASAWVREQRELSCDRFVARVTRQPAEYARVLVSLATSQHANKPIDLVSCSSTRHSLVSRVARLLGREETMKIRTQSVVCSVMACCLVGFACVKSMAASDAPQKRSAQSDEVQPPKQETEVETKKKPTQRTERIKFNGRTLLVDHIRLSARQAGVLSKVPEIGDRVEKGSVVAALGNQSQRLAIENVQARLGEPIDLLVAEKRLDLAQKQLAAAKAKTRTHSERELEVIAGEVDLAKLEVTRERSKLRQLKSQLRLAELALAETELRSPFTGRVTKVNKSVGEAVNTGETVVEITSRKRLRVQFYVNGSDIARLSRGMQIEFVPYRFSRDGRKLNLTGKITSFSDKLSQVNQTIAVTAVIDNSQELLRADQTGYVHVMVPAAASSNDEGESSVTVKQRQSKRVLNGARLSIDDITGGQVLVTFEDRRGKKLITEKSMKLGDACEFELEGTPYKLRINQLTNVLIGTDFAVFDIEKVGGKGKDGGSRN